MSLVTSLVRSDNAGHVFVTKLIYESIRNEMGKETYCQNEISHGFVLFQGLPLPLPEIRENSSMTVCTEQQTETITPPPTCTYYEGNVCKL